MKLIHSIQNSEKLHPIQVTLQALWQLQVKMEIKLIEDKHLLAFGKYRDKKPKSCEEMEVRVLFDPIYIESIYDSRLSFRSHAMLWGGQIVALIRQNKKKT